MLSRRKLAAVIVEDEEGPRQLLKRLLQRAHSNAIEIVAEAETGPAALAACEKYAPDVLFLDLNLPVFGGLELLDRLRTQVYVVVTTGDSRQAAMAHPARRFDLLPKPVDPEELKEAIARIVSAATTRRFVRLLCRDQDALKVVRTDDVLFLHGEGDSTFVHVENRRYLLEEILESLEESLPDHFVRVDDMTIVNVHHVVKLDTSSSVTSVGDGCHPIAVSPDRLRELRKKLTYEK